MKMLIIEKKIGDGATSQCFKCFSFTNQNTFALKLFSENNIKEYLTERQILSKLKNEPIAGIILAMGFVIALILLS